MEIQRNTCIMCFWLVRASRSWCSVWDNIYYIKEKLFAEIDVSGGYCFFPQNAKIWKPLKISLKMRLRYHSTANSRKNQNQAGIIWAFASISRKRAKNVLRKFPKCSGPFRSCSFFWWNFQNLSSPLEDTTDLWFEKIEKKNCLFPRLNKKIKNKKLACF